MDSLNIFSQKENENERKLLFSRELINQFYPDAKDLFKQDWEETTSDGIEFEIDEESYRVLEKHGRLAIFTARTAGKLAGYIGFTVSESMHHKRKIANCTGLFVLKEYRGRTGLFLTKYAIGQLKSYGIDKIRISSSSKNDIGKFLGRMNFKHEESVYGLMLT